MGFELVGTAIWPPQLAGLLMATVGMIAGSYFFPDVSSR
jgi:hypothetical protein